MEENQTNAPKEEMSREDLIFLANVMKDQDCPEVTIKYMLRAVALDPHLTETEQILFATPYRTIANRLRDSLAHVHQVYHSEETHTESQAVALTELRSDLTFQLIALSDELCSIVSEQLLPNCENPADKCVYHLLLADFSRYVAELEVEQSAAAGATSAENYQIAIQFSETFSPAHPTRLSACLNYAKLLYDTLDNQDEAVSVARKAFNDGNPAVAEITDPMMHQSAEEILYILMDNVIKWSSK